MKSIYNKVRFTILVFVAISSIYIYFAMYKPLNVELEQEIVNSFEQVTYSKHILFEQKILKNRQSAERLSGRTGTRNYLASYLDGQVYLDELRHYTSTHYDDHLKEFNNIEFIKRVAIDGSFIYSVGEDKNYSYTINWQRHEIYTQFLPEDNLLYIQSPIIGGDRLLGYDIVLLDFKPFIESIANDTYDIEIISGLTLRKLLFKDGKIITYMPCEYIAGTMVFSMDETAAFANLKDMHGVIVILNLMGIIVAFAILQFLILKYIRRFVTTQSRLKSAAQDIARERNLLIDKMTKGFLEIRIKEDASGMGKIYKIISANAAFSHMIGKNKDQIRGKNLFELIPIKDKEPINKIIEEVLDLENTGARTECFIDGLGKWWTISVYSPKEDILALICEDITESKLLNEKIKESEETLSIVFDVTGEGLWNLDLTSSLLSYNNRWAEIFGLDNNKDFTHLGEYIAMIHPADKDRVKSEISKCVRMQENYESEHRMIRPDGQVIWIVVRGTFIKDKNGFPVRMIGSISDITEQKQAEIDLMTEKEMFQATLMSVGDGIIATDVEGNIIMINPIAESIIGYNREEVLGKSMDDICILLDPTSKEQNDELKFAFIKDILMDRNICLSDDGSLLLGPNGKVTRIARKVSAIVLPDGDVIGFVTAFRDITSQYEKRKRIEYLSTHDELTGLYNRHYMQESKNKLDNEENLPLTIMIIDLNNLKLANDVFGHKKGDELLKKAAKFLTDTFRPQDIIGRIGGDEFAIILPKTPIEAAKKIIKKIHKESYKYIAEPIILSLSVGFATKINPEERIDSIIREADADMYHDKQINREMVKERLLASFLHKNNENIISEKDHTIRVGKLAASLYKALGKSKEEVANFSKAVRLHDIGKIIVPKEVINKVAPLTEDEWRIIKTHTQASYQILRVMHEYEMHAEAILYHHERLDGTGYPQGLVGDEIPLESRVLAIADAYEAMISNRPYKKAMSIDEAIMELRRCSGSQFDGELVEIFIEKVLNK